MAKFKEKNLARQMRKNGQSIKEIAISLHVSPSSVSTWCFDVELTENQKRTLEYRAHDPNYGKRLQNSIKQRKFKEEKIERLRLEGIKQIGQLSKRDLFIAGVALYWGEGFKKDSQAGLASLNPDIIKFYIKWLKKCFGYSEEDFLLRVTINSSHKYRVEEIENYWSKLLNIPINSFRKPFYQNFKWKKVYENPENYHGVLRVKVRKSKDFLRKIVGMIEGLSEI